MGPFSLVNHLNIRCDGTDMSQQPVDKLYPRSPRYVLQMKDTKVLRYAPYPRGHRSFFTDIVNLSETGMAFTVPYLDSPHKNEIIMVEFTPPGATTSVACYAQVQRIQNISMIEPDFFQKNCKLVAVTFTSLKPEQREQIKNVLSQKFKKINHHFRWQQMKMKFLWTLKFQQKKILKLSAVISALALLTSAILFMVYG